MTSAAVLMCLSFTTASANVSTLDGSTTSGMVAAIADGSVSLEANGKTAKFPFGTILEVRFEPSSTSTSPQSTDKAPVAVQLAD